MRNLMNRLLTGIIPIFGMLLFLAVFIVGIIFFSYLVLIIAVIGFVLFTTTYLRAKIFLWRHPTSQNKKETGRTIDHDDKTSPPPAS